MSSRLRPATGSCGGDGCAAARDPWPLHHVRHRGVYCRLCSSCVLLYHPSLFCSSCLLLLPPDDSPRHAADPLVAAGDVARCSRCPAVAHLACLGSAAAADDFVCPSCAAAGEGARFSYLPPPGGDGRRRVDGRAALVLLVAARLAAASMGRAAAAARADAERKGREAAAVRKRARDMLEAAFVAATAAAGEAAAPPPKKPNAAAAADPKKKVAKVSELAARAKKPQPTNRDRDKLLKFNAMPPLPAHAAIGSGDVKKMAFAAAAAAAAARGNVGEERRPGPHLGANAKEKTNSQMATTQGAAAMVKDERRTLFGSLRS